MRPLLLALALLAAACAPPPPPPLPPPPPPPPPPAAPPSTQAQAAEPDQTEWRAVFHLSDPGRPANARGLQSAMNAIKALGDAKIHFVIVVHGPALGWFRRAEPDNLAEPLAQLLATGFVDLDVCARSLDEYHWKIGDILPGARSVPSGTVEVIRLQREGFAYFKP